MRMAANVTVTPGAVERKSQKKTRPPTADASQSQVPESSMQENIAKLAYALWQHRGCPYRSPEVDWMEAEHKLRESSEHIWR